MTGMTRRTARPAKYAWNMTGMARIARARSLGYAAEKYACHILGIFYWHPRLFGVFSGVISMTPEICQEYDMHVFLRLFTVTVIFLAYDVPGAGGLGKNHGSIPFP